MCQEMSVEPSQLDWVFHKVIVYKICVCYARLSRTRFDFELEVLIRSLIHISLDFQVILALANTLCVWAL
jgi:hypothetical protein